MNKKEAITDLILRDYTGSNDVKELINYLDDQGYFSDLQTTKKLVRFCYEQMKPHYLNKSEELKEVLASTFFVSTSSINHYLFR